MKRFLLALAVTGISANAWAATIECNKVDVASACKGYDKKPNDCLGVPTLVCPFDTEKVFCAHKHCEVGDVLYADGHCYGDLPVPRFTTDSNSPNIMPVGVVVDTEAKLAVLPRAYTGANLAWQEGIEQLYGNGVSYAMWASTCMNRDMNTSPITMLKNYSSDFPQPETDGCSYTYSGISHGCGTPSSTSFNWDISPLLQKVLSPLKNFTPIKSAHAIINPGNYTFGCAIPYVATTQEDCISTPGKCGSFYTQRLMEFQTANADKEFSTYYIRDGGMGTSNDEVISTSIKGIKFPAAEHCANMTSISDGAQTAFISPFLPSVADLKQMLNEDNILAIVKGLAAIDPAEGPHSCEDVADINDFASYSGGCPVVSIFYLANTRLWSSQQYSMLSSTGTTTYWEHAMAVRLHQETTDFTFEDDALRNEKGFTWCFMNYQEGVGFNNANNYTGDSDMLEGITGNQTIAP